MPAPVRGLYLLFSTAMDDPPPNLTSRAEPSASTVSAETATATHLTFSQALQTVQEPDVSAPRAAVHVPG